MEDVHVDAGAVIAVTCLRLQVAVSCEGIGELCTHLQRLYFVRLATSWMNSTPISLLAGSRQLRRDAIFMVRDISS